MTKKQLMEENKNLRDALKRITEIEKEPTVIKAKKEYPDLSIYPTEIGVMKAIAEYALNPNWNPLHTNKTDKERKTALQYQKKTGKIMYFYDDSGDEYWYSEDDTVKHYTRSEG